MKQLLLIAAGGSIGAVARYGVSNLVYAFMSESFPWGTLVVNVSGSFLIGMLAELFDAALFPAEWRSFLAIGFLGAYTTFSTYTLETVNMLRDGELKLATANILAGNVAGIAAVVLGIYVSRFIIKSLA
jgi:CrcB protein